MYSLGFDEAEGEAPETEAVERLEYELRSAAAAAAAEASVELERCACACELLPAAAAALEEAEAADLLASNVCSRSSGDLSRSLRYCSVSAGSTSESRPCEHRRVTTSSNVFRSRVSESC